MPASLAPGARGFTNSGVLVANNHQTDTYLSAKISGLRESMKRFDAARGKLVAKPPVAEHRPLGHAGAEESTKDQLH